MSGDDAPTPLSAGPGPLAALDAAVGRSSPLAGLVFVAVSINIDVIVADRPAPDYAAGALIMLVSPVFVGLAVAIPRQGPTALAIELLALAGVLAGALGWFHRPSARASDHTVRQWWVTNVLPPRGLVGAWMLLVEIRRPD